MSVTGMKFCHECNNMLYPHENQEKHILKYGCRNCGYSENVDISCIYKNELLKGQKTMLNSLPDDIIEDPTLQRDYTVICPNCDNQGACFMRAHDGAKERTLGLVWICLNYECRYRWMTTKS